jgi:serine/threonine protein kinase
MEYMDGGSLNDALNKRREQNNFFPWPVCYRIALHITNGLKFLHKNNVYHRDLKTDNVLLCKRPGDPFFAKLADFGVSILYTGEIEGGSLLSTEAKGTLKWMAPEVLPAMFGQIYRYNPATDVYSLVMIFWALTKHEDPYKDKGQHEIASFVIEGGRENIPESTLVFFRELIEWCWEQQAKHRPTVAQIINILVELIEKNPLVETEGETEKTEYNAKGKEEETVSTNRRKEGEKEECDEDIIEISKLSAEREKQWRMGPRAVDEFEPQEAFDISQTQGEPSGPSGNTSALLPSISGSSMIFLPSPPQERNARERIEQKKSNFGLNT